MRAPAAALAAALSLLAAPAAAACGIELRIENRGTGALEIVPDAWDSGVRLLGATAGGPGGFAGWDAATILQPGDSVARTLAAPEVSTCGEPRRIQIAYRCLAGDGKGIAVAAYPPEEGETGSVTIPLTRCE